MHILTGSGTYPHGAQIVLITCQACSYFEEHFRQQGLRKVGRPCDRCQEKKRKP